MKQFVSVSSRSRSMFLLLVILTLGAVLAAAVELQPARSQDGAVVFVRPPRRPPGNVPAPLPVLPARADEIEPLTFAVLTHRVPRAGAASRELQRMSRTRDRVHVATVRTEWLFERNPVDPRRVSALLVHHPSRTIVTHEESDLRNAVGVSGWAAVLMLGVDPAVLSVLTPTTDLRTDAGLSFRKHAATSDGLGLVEVWWNSEHLLPLTVVSRDEAGMTRVTIQQLERGVDATLLRPPAARFPDYRLVDLAEWLEGH